MDLDLTDEQRALSETLRKMLADLSPPKVVRQMEDDPLGFPPALWKAIADMGLTGLSLPDEYGGSALGAVETAVTYEEFGRALCPSPHFVSSVLAAGMLRHVGDAKQRDAWLPAIARGEAIITVALLEPGGDYGPTGIQLQGHPGADGYRLSGTKSCVLFASAAHRLLVPVRVGPAEGDIDFLLVDPASPGISMRQQFTTARDTQYEIRFENVAVPLSARIGAPKEGWEHWLAVSEEGMIALAAWAVGCADRALEMASTYAKERVQFDRPIGSFQGIAHPLATVAIEVAGARTLVHQAAWAHATNRPAKRLAAMAKLYADAANRHATVVGHQTLGGIGFTIDIDMQLYQRRAKQSQLSWWDAKTLEEQIADSVFEEGESHGL